MPLQAQALILQHYQAQAKHTALEQQLDTLVKALNPDNGADLIDSPWQTLVEQIIQGLDPDLWDWYCWYLYEGGVYSINNQAYHSHKFGPCAIR